MKNHWKLCIIFVLVHVSVCGFTSAQDEDLKRLSERLPYVNYHDFLYGKENPANFDVIPEAIVNEVSIRELKELVAHQDARIRTLALMKLFISGDPQAFHVIHGRLGDEGLAFPAVSRFSNAIFFDPTGTVKEPKVHTQERKVGEVARMMMEMIGYHGKEDFQSWSEGRLDNPNWLGWYEFLLKRITHGSLPAPKEIGEPLANFNQLLDQRPLALRAWLGFVVADEAMMVPIEDTVLGTELELIEAGKVLEPDELLAFLRNGTRAGLNDPNMDSSKRGHRFILRHARELFRVNDAEALKEMGYFIAAADLRPDMAPVWLREACIKWKKPYQSWDRARAMAALLELCGEKEMKFVVDWFYQTESASSGSSDQSVFIHEYQRRSPKDWKNSVVALVAHPGFSRIKPLDLIYLGLMINDLHGADVVDQELRHKEHEAELRNVLRRFLGLQEKPVKWIDFNEGTHVSAEWTVSMDAVARRLVISPDGATLAIGMRDGQVEIRKASDGSYIGVIPANGGLAALNFHGKDGKLLVMRSSGMMEMWDVMPIESVKTLKLSGFQTTESCMDPNGDWIATRQANGDGVSVYDLMTGKRRWNMKTAIRAFGLIGVSPDGSRFAVCDGFYRTVMLFTPEKQEPLARLEGHSGTPAHVAFSTDGASLITTGEDSKILVWDAKTGGLISEFVSRQRFVNVLQCNGDTAESFFFGVSGKLALVDLASGQATKSLLHGGIWVAAMASNEQSVFAVVTTNRGGSALVRWHLTDK